MSFQPEGMQPEGMQPEGYQPNAESNPSAQFITAVVLSLLGQSERPIVPERMTQVLSFAFQDESEEAVTPTSVRWRIDCLTTGRQVRAWTLADAQASGQITLEPDDMAIIDRVNKEERHVVHVEASYGSGQQARDSLEFTVERMTGLS